MKAWPLTVLEGPTDIGGADERAAQLWQSHLWWLRMREARDRDGVAGMLRAGGLSVRLAGQAIGQLAAAVVGRLGGRRQ